MLIPLYEHPIQKPCQFADYANAIFKHDSMYDKKVASVVTLRSEII